MYGVVNRKRKRRAGKKVRERIAKAIARDARLYQQVLEKNPSQIEIIDECIKEAYTDHIYNGESDDSTKTTVIQRSPIRQLEPTTSYQTSPPEVYPTSHSNQSESSCSWTDNLSEGRNNDQYRYPAPPPPYPEQVYYEGPPPQTIIHHSVDYQGAQCIISTIEATLSQQIFNTAHHDSNSQPSTPKIVEIVDLD